VAARNEDIVMDQFPMRDRLTGAEFFEFPDQKRTEIQNLPSTDLVDERQFYDLSPRNGLAKRISRGRVDLAPDDLEKTRLLRDDCVAMARRASEAFADACEAETEDEAEASFLVAKRFVENLWEYAYLRDQPFRDLLALVDAALKRAELPQLSQAQRDSVREALSDIHRWLLDEDTVEEHIERFAEHDVDITGPLRSTTGRKVRVTFEEVAE